MSNIVDMNMNPSLPSKPERPLDSDCCGQGCEPCVLDLYEQEVKVWEEECQRILTGEKPKDSSCNDVEQLSLTEYRNFTVEDVSRETADTCRYRFTLPRGATLGLKPGEHIVIRSLNDGQSITRQYTPVSDVNVRSYFDLIIKVYEDGKMSQSVRKWEVGSQIQTRGPFGSLVYKPNKYKKVYMLAVGTGIAPMCQMIQTILNNEDDETLVQLLYGCRTYEDILMKTEILEWQRYWNFSCTYFLSQEQQEENPKCYKYGEKIQHSRITQDVLSTVITDTHDNILVLICGTRSFEKDMIDAMAALNIPQDKYHKF